MDQIIDELLNYNIEDSEELQTIKKKIKQLDDLSEYDILFLNESYINKIKTDNMDPNLKCKIYIYLYIYKLKVTKTIKNKILDLLLQTNNLNDYITNLRDFLNYEFKIKNKTNFENQKYITVINKLLDFILYIKAANVITEKSNINTLLMQLTDDYNKYINMLSELIIKIFNITLSNEIITHLNITYKLEEIKKIKSDSINVSANKKIDNLRFIEEVTDQITKNSILYNLNLVTDK